MKSILVALLCALFATLPPQVFASEPCHKDISCVLDGRSYHVLEPDGWDGVTALPVLVHFHGWQRTGALPVQHQRISGATRRRGVLLVAPNGLHKTWDFWQPETKDVSFAEALLADVRARYPIDPENIYLSGYSYGSIMAWRVACDRGSQLNIRALLAISGTLDPFEECDEAPQEVRHVHGLKDNVLDYPFGPQGEVTYPVRLWRDALGCAGSMQIAEWNAVSFLQFERRVWPSCVHGTQVVLDTHPGGHFIPHGWIARQLDELLGRTPSYP